MLLLRVIVIVVVEIEREKKKEREIFKERTRQLFLVQIRPDFHSFFWLISIGTLPSRSKELRERFCGFVLRYVGRKRKMREIDR